MISIAQFVRDLTAPAKRTLYEFRKNIQAGDKCTWRGKTHVVMDVAEAVYAKKIVRLAADDEQKHDVGWISVAEVFLCNS